MTWTGQDSDGDKHKDGNRETRGDVDKDRNSYTNIRSRTRTKMRTRVGTRTGESKRDITETGDTKGTFSSLTFIIISNRVLHQRDGRRLHCFNRRQGATSAYSNGSRKKKHKEAV